MNYHRLPVLNLVDNSLCILNKTNIFCDLGFLSKKGVFPYIIYSNHVSTASVTDKLAEYIANYNKEVTRRGIILSDEFCQKVWFVALLTMTIAQSLDYLPGDDIRHSITDKAFYDSIESNYAWFVKCLPSLISKEEKSDIYVARGIQIPECTVELSDLNTNYPDYKVSYFSDLITQFSIAFLIGHELSHVYLDHCNSEPNIENENNADQMSITEILSTTPENLQVFARIGFMVPQMTLLLTKNLRVKKDNTHPDDDIRLLSIFNLSYNNTDERWQMSIIMAAMIGIWAKLYQRDDFPNFNTIKDNPEEVMRAFLDKAKTRT